MLPQVAERASSRSTSAPWSPRPAPGRRGRRLRCARPDGRRRRRSPRRSAAACRCAGRCGPGSVLGQRARSRSAAAASAPGAVGKATKNASPWVSTSTPPWRGERPRAGCAGARPARRHSVGAELVEQPRRALDIGEQERDRAARKLVAHEKKHRARRAHCLGLPTSSGSLTRPGVSRGSANSPTATGCSTCGEPRPSLATGPRATPRAACATDRIIHLSTTEASGRDRRPTQTGDGAASGVPTKLWISDYGYEPALHGFDGCLRRLGIDYVDLFLLHHPVPSDFDGTIAATRLLSRCWRTGARVPSGSRTSARTISRTS